MEQKELVGKRVLVRLGALPREEQEQCASEPVFERFSIVEVVGYNSRVPYQVTVDSNCLGWSGCALRDTDILAREAETYWYVYLDDIVTVLE